MTPQPSQTEPIQIRVMDAPEVKAALDAAAEEINRLRAECDEWEERYEDLLSRCGGTLP